MANWSSRLFFYFMVLFLVYVILIGDAGKWKSLLTTPNKTVSNLPGQYGATGSY